MIKVVEVGIEKLTPYKMNPRQKEADKALYGGGFLLSEKAAAEKAAAEKAAAEKAAATRWPLSERERAIIKRLSK